MVKVITYGSFDMLHYGHLRLLKRAKALGDYLIVGVTSDDYDKTRGKINLQQSLMERVEAVKATCIPDEVIIEEFEGQKIEDIKKYNIDIFTVGSDWEGYFDYLTNYCKVIYLPRTEGISSSRIRSKQRKIKLGLVGDSTFLNKLINESKYVNGIELVAVCTLNKNILSDNLVNSIFVTDDLNKMIEITDAIYIRSTPEKHYQQIEAALLKGKHVLCESPVCLNEKDYLKLANLAEKQGIILMEAIKTAYSNAYSRLLLLLKTGIIGDIISVDATCTRLESFDSLIENDWDGLFEWGPTALLPVYQILGTDIKQMNSYVKIKDSNLLKTEFVLSSLIFDSAVATIKIGNGVKSEGDLVVSGTCGYAYVPAPWWKTDYFEIRFENQTNNRRYFYQLEGEGIRYELVSFAKAIETGKDIYSNIDISIGCAISRYMNKIYNERNMIII